MKFKTQDHISGSALQKGLRYVVVDGVMSHIMGVLTGGLFFACESYISNI